MRNSWLSYMSRGEWRNEFIFWGRMRQVQSVRNQLFYFMLDFHYILLRTTLLRNYQQYLFLDRWWFHSMGLSIKSNLLKQWGERVEVDWDSQSVQSGVIQFFIKVSLESIETTIPYNILFRHLSTDIQTKLDFTCSSIRSSHLMTVALPLHNFLH